MSSLDEQVSTFMAITGCGNPEEAKSFLEMSNSNLEVAVSLFLDQGLGSSSGNPGGAGGQAGNGPNAGDNDNPIIPPEEDENVRAPMAAFDDRLIEQRKVDEKIHRERMAKDHDDYVSRMAFDASTNEIPKAGRKKKGKDPLPPNVLNTLFSGPSYSEKGSFADAIQKANLNKQYILVNIQRKDEFTSHQLNRDIWSDELVEEIIRGNFVFWQRDDLSDQGKTFCSYYNIHTFPWICFIDPRTNRCLKGWDAQKWREPSVATEFMSNFLDKYSLNEGGDVGGTGHAGPPPLKKLRSDNNTPAFGNGSGGQSLPSSAAASNVDMNDVPSNGMNGVESTFGINSAIGQGQNLSGSGAGGAAASSSSYTGGPGYTGAAGGASGSSSSVLGAGNMLGGNPTSMTTTNMETGESGGSPSTKKVIPPLPDEPAEGETGVVKVSFKLVDGSRKNVRVLNEHTINRLLEIAAHYSDLEIDEVDLTTAFPKRSLRGLGLEKSVKEADVAGEMLAVRKIDA